MKLIVGLGNPGNEYKYTRHNVGFLAVDEIAKKLGITFRLETKFEGEIAIGNYKGEKVILLKPSTYMNLSGNSIIKVYNYYKIDKNSLLVIYDDMDLDCGRLRLRQNGSAGGHNGIKSIISHLTQEFNRVRVGIGKDSRYDVVDYVLGKFSEDEMSLMNQAFEKTTNLAIDFINNISFDRIMNKYNVK